VWLGSIRSNRDHKRVQEKFGAFMTTISARDYESYMRTARQRAQKRRKNSSRRQAKAWEAARRAAAFIKEGYPQAHVFVFGSLLYSDSFGTRSDIDLAVEGIKWPDYLRVWSALEKREPEFEIDLVDVGIVSKGLRAHIKREGVPI
jgi:predicted nucleotidyltransferase